MMKTEKDMLKQFIYGSILFIVFILVLCYFEANNDLFCISFISLIIVFIAITLSYERDHRLGNLSVVLSIFYVFFVVLYWHNPYIIAISPISINECYNITPGQQLNNQQIFSIRNLGTELRDVKIAVNNTNWTENEISFEPKTIPYMNISEKRDISVNLGLVQKNCIYSGDIIISCEDFSKSVPFKLTVNLESDGKSNRKPCGIIAIYNPLAQFICPEWICSII